MNKYRPWLLIVLATVGYPTAKSAAVADAKGQPKTAETDANQEKEIPIGFKLERYSPVWERNPFTLVTPAVPQAQHSPFEKLFLTSWLKDGPRDVIFIQNLETNEVQKITAEPNQDNLRLITLHLNPNPQLVEAVISDGKEQGPVKFRFDVQSSVAQMASPPAQITNKGVAALASNPAQAASATLPRPQLNPPNAQTSALPATAPADQPLTRPGSAYPRAPIQGGPGSTPRGQQSEGVRLPTPGQL